MKLCLLLQFGALLHIGLLFAGAVMPAAVQLRGHLSTLPLFPRRLFWVYYAFIGFVLISFGLLTWFQAIPMASGAGVGRALSVVMACFWLLRSAMSMFVLDVRPYLTSATRRLGYGALNAVFAYLTLIYAWAAVKGGN